MKTRTKLTAISLLLSSFGVFAQQEKVQPINSSDISPIPVKSHIKTEPVTAAPIVVTSENSVTKEDMNYPITVSSTHSKKKQSDAPRTIEDIDTDIKNIKEKMDYVKNSPEMDEKAREEGWYVRNEELLKNLETEKSILLNK